MQLVLLEPILEIKVKQTYRNLKYVELCAIWYCLYNFKNMKNTHGRQLFLVKLQTSACNFTKRNTPLWAFFTFFKL